MNTLQQPILWAIIQPVLFGQGSGVFSLPPASDELLIWLKGISTDTQKTDSWAKPDAENFDIKQSNCISLNGVDEVGATSIAHGTIVSYEGSATPSYSGTALTFTEGTFYNVTFSDGTHYRIAEGNESAYSWSDDGTRYITWTGSLDEMWAQRQDTYHGNCVDGFGKGANGIINSETFDSSTWNNGNGLTKTSGITDPNGGTKAVEFHATIDNGTITSGATTDVGVPTTFLIWMRRVAGDGIVQIYNGIAYVDVQSQLTDEWKLIEIPSATGRLSLLLRLRLAGDKIQVAFPQSGTVPIGPYIETGDYTFDGTEYLPFLNTNPGGTFNDCESAFGPESFPVGTGNGTDDYITTTVSLGAGGVAEGYLSCSFVYDGVSDIMLIGAGSAPNRCYLGISNTGVISGGLGGDNLSALGGTTVLVSGQYYTAKIKWDSSNVDISLNDVIEKTKVQNGVPLADDVFEIYRWDTNIYCFQGIIRDVNINGTLIPINEGTGNDIHDSEGNLVGTLTGDETFWSGEPMVSPEVIDMEAVRTLPYLTDGDGHPVYNTEQTWLSDATINTDDQYFRKDCVGSNTEYYFYKEVLTGDNLVDALVECCLAEWVTFNGSIVTSDGEKVYVRI